ncbi:MFS transporter [Streptomyces sp. NPDC005549]|uniref:MFS transporter n=1 Tax=Streptomyces sp. NPDC005549 TaxID=3154888 RepID=UPI0033A0421F
MASVAAGSIEFYDFAIYGTAAALVFNTHFFPSDVPTVGQLLSFATFAVGFAGRPLGAVIFGHYGDKYGRKPALIAAMVLMGASSVAIGLLPTYEVVGISAPILLVLLRVCQGIAFGGQWGGSTLLSFENAPPDRRGLFGAMSQMGNFFGMVAGTLVFLLLTNVMSDHQFLLWGWRLPFLLTVVTFFVVLYIHKQIDETSEFDAGAAGPEESPAEEAKVARAESAVIQVIRRPKQMILVILCFVSAALTFYVIATGMLDYATRELGVPRSEVLAITMLAMIPWLIGTVGFGWLSDVVGRRPVYIGGAIFSALWAFALFPLVETQNFWLMLMACGVGQFGATAMSGPAVALFMEMFPPSKRYSGASMGYQIANVLGGGLAPFTMVALLNATGTTMSVSIYVAVAAALCIIPVALTRPDPSA